MDQVAQVMAANPYGVGLSGYSGLAAAVVLQAHQAAKKGDLVAAAWLGSDQAEPFLEVAGIDRKAVDRYLVNIFSGVNNDFKRLISARGRSLNS